MNREEFESLTAEGQWLWVIKNKALVEIIELDNDCTYVCSPCFKEPGNEECSGSISMKSYLGNGPGINHLMAALDIKCGGV